MHACVKRACVKHACVHRACVHRASTCLTYLNAYLLALAYVQGLGAVEGTFFAPREPQPETKLISAEKFRAGSRATRLNDQPTCWHLRVRERVMVRGGEGEGGGEGYALPARRNQQPSRSMTTSSAQGEGRDCLELPRWLAAPVTHARAVLVFVSHCAC